MPTVEFGAVVWVAAPDQSIAAVGIPSTQAVGSGLAARAILPASISSYERVGNVAATPGAVTVVAYGIASEEILGVIIADVIVEGARVSLVGVRLKYRATAGYQKRYSGHTTRRVVAGYQRRYSGYVLEHEMLAAAAEFSEV